MGTCSGIALSKRHRDILFEERSMLFEKKVKPLLWPVDGVKEQRCNLIDRATDKMKEEQAEIRRLRTINYHKTN